MGANPAVDQVEDYPENEQADQQYGDPAQPTLHQPYAAPKEVAHKDHRRSPYGPSQGVVEDEGPPPHPAYASDQGTKDAQAGEEACQKYGLPPVPLDERFGTCQPLGADQDVAPPFARDTVADLVADSGPQDAEHYETPQPTRSMPDQSTGGEEYGITRQRH